MHIYWSLLLKSVFISFFSLILFSKFSILSLIFFQLLFESLGELKIVLFELLQIRSVWPIWGKPLFYRTEYKIFRVQVSTIPIFYTIDWDISKISPFYFMNWFIILKDMCLEMIWWSLFNLIVLDFTSDFILFILNYKWVNLLNSACPEECSWKFICRIVCLDDCTILKLESSFALVSYF